jgi:cellobiose phosphorylase
VLAYLKESGDLGLLEEEVGYYDSVIKESVLTHVKRGMEYLFSRQGVHGLGLWGGGDWNDALNTGGLEWKGESVWLSIATVKAGKDYIEILRVSKLSEKEDLIAETQAKIVELEKNIQEYGFEEDRYIYAYNDWGEKVGSEESREGKHFLNTQTWAVIADIDEKATQEKVMDKVEENLRCEYGYMQMKPCYATPDDRLGRITYNQKGVYENGAVYLHGVMFKLVADCLLERGDNALKTLEMIRYDNPENLNSGVEPYAVSNMYYGPEAVAQKGFAPCSWITGSAGWLYRAITEFMLGIHAEFNGLRIAPVLPKAWGQVCVERIFRNVKYQIEIVCGNEEKLLIDGKEVAGNLVPIFEKDSVHKVVCFMKQK